MKIFIVDDHPLMRETLVAFLTETSGYEVCGAAATAEEALGQLPEMEADLALLDVSLPGQSGIELAEVIHARWPALKCVMLSAHGERSYVRQALAADAKGYVLKGDLYELRGAIDAVMRGETYLSASLQAA